MHDSGERLFPLFWQWIPWNQIVSVSSVSSVSICTPLNTISLTHWSCTIDQLVPCFCWQYSLFSYFGLSLRPVLCSCVLWMGFFNIPVLFLLLSSYLSCVLCLCSSCSWEHLLTITTDRPQFFISFDSLLHLSQKQNNDNDNNNNNNILCSPHN